MTNSNRRGEVSPSETGDLDKNQQSELVKRLVGEIPNVLTIEELAKAKAELLLTVDPADSGFNEVDALVAKRLKELFAEKVRGNM